MRHSLLIFALLLKASIIRCHRLLELESVREWKQLDFNFPNQRARDDAIHKGLFVPENAVPIDVEADYQGEESNYLRSRFVYSFLV